MGNQWDSQWTDESIEIAMRLPTLEAAEVLGRTPAAIYGMRHRVRNGYAPKPRVSAGERTILAKTCPQCGFLLSADFFGKRLDRKGRRRLRSWCSWCMTERTSQNRRDRQARGLTDRRTSDVDLPAPRSGFRWTEFDHKVAADPDLTVTEKALKTGRSYRAITQACSKNHYSSLDSPWLGEKEEQWVIRFPS